MRSLDKSSRPVVQIQKQNHREVDRSLEGEPSAPNTSTKTKKNTPFQTEKVADFEIQDHEYDRRTEIANPVEQDKVDREQLQFNDIEATLPSSPPYSPPKVTLLFYFFSSLTQDPNRKMPPNNLRPQRLCPTLFYPLQTG